MPKSSSVPTKTKSINKKATAKLATSKKPATKKVAAKKPVAKKLVQKATANTTTKVSAAKSLVYAPDQHSFWVSNGEILNSLTALRDALAAMDDRVYTHHARPEQNDFAIWVNDVLCDNECAQALAKAKTPKSAHTVVVRHLKFYAV